MILTLNRWFVSIYSHYTQIWLTIGFYLFVLRSTITNFHELEREKWLFQPETVNYRSAGISNLFILYKWFIVIHAPHIHTYCITKDDNRVLFHGMGLFFLFQPFTSYLFILSFIVVATRKYGNPIGFQPWLFIWTFNRPIYVYKIDIFVLISTLLLLAI